MTDQSNPPSTLIVGISGPSSSGKTTLARLLQRIFCGVNLEKEQQLNLNTFIIHEDDFYYPDDQIPYTTLPSGKQIQDWDTSAAIDTNYLTQALSYVRKNGHLPPRLSSKEDQNEKGDSGVENSLVEELRALVEKKLSSAFAQSSSSSQSSTSAQPLPRTVAFMEGFLLYAPPSPPRQEQEQKRNQSETIQAHPLRKVHDQIHLPLFLPAPYTSVKSRREGRAGYVTIGPGIEQPEPGEGNTAIKPEKEIDLDVEGDEGEFAPQNFWVDPPGYVDDIVWPRYVEDHAWLIVPEEGEGEGQGQKQGADLVKAVGEGVCLKTDVGVNVAPGKGAVGMDVLVRWAVGEVLGALGV